jgi:hypothetical protein
MANLTLRSVKGSPLTNAELDGNFEYFTGSHSITGSLTVSNNITSNGYTVVTSNQTGSFVTNTGTGSFATTGSNAFTGNQTISGSLTTTGSVNITGSINVNGSTVVTSNQTGSLIVNTGSFAITGSNIFIGNQTLSGSILISGSIIPNVSSTSTTSSFSLGSLTNAWKDIFVSNGTINFLNGAGQVQASLGAGSSGTTITGGTNISGQLIVTPTSITSSQFAQIYQNQKPSCNFRLVAGSTYNVDLYYYGSIRVLPFDKTYVAYSILTNSSDATLSQVYLPPYYTSGHSPGEPVTIYNMNFNPALAPISVYALAQQITTFNPSTPKQITGLSNTAGLFSGSYGQAIDNFNTTASIPSGYKGVFELINVGYSQALTASISTYPTVNDGVYTNYGFDGNQLRWKLISVLPI